MSLLSESEQIERAIRGVVKKIIDEETRDCLRVKKAIVSTAPDENTGLCGVQLVGDNTELLIPFSSAVASASVGDAVLVATIYNSMRNAVVWQTSPLG